MEKLFELSFQDQTLNPQIGTFTDVSQATGTFTLEDGEYYLTNGDTKGFYAYAPVAMQSGVVDDSKVIIEFDLKVVTASANTHVIIGTYAGVDGSGIPTGAKITLQYNAGDIELVLGSGTTATLIAAADVVVNQWYHFRIDCMLAVPLASTYQVKIDGVSVTTVTGATADYALGIISVLGTDQHACDECGIKNITLVTETNLYVGRTALDQALQDVKGYVDSHCVNLTSSQTVGGNKTFSNDIITLGNQIVLQRNSVERTVLPASTVYMNMVFGDKNGGGTNARLSCVENVLKPNGDINLDLRAFDFSSKTNTHTTIVLERKYDGTSNFYPETNNAVELGTSTNKWKSVYSNAYYLGATAFGDIVTHNASEFVQVSDLATDKDMAEMAETWSI